MTLAPRWRKLLGDLTAAQGRVALMVTALAIGLFAVATIAGAYSILSREISRNYLNTNPASALIDVGAVTPEIMAMIAADPEIANAEPATIAEGQGLDAQGNWQRTLMFVVPDLAKASIGTVFAQDGAFPPPPGAVALEREGLEFLGVARGGAISLRLPGHAPQSLPVAGIVHDPSLAPSWQEQTAYTYLSPATFAQLGGSATLELVKVVVRNATFDQARTEAVVGALAQRLQASGVTIHQIQIPPAGQHPHQTQMNSVLGMFLVFAVLALLLSAMLTATMVSGLLAQQIRQIAIMKAVGGTTRQIATLYFVGVTAIAALATAIAIPLGLAAGNGFAGVIAELLNFDIGSPDIPLWLLANLIAVGLLLPLIFVALPIRRATRFTVREALADQGLTRDVLTMGPVQRLLGRLAGSDRALALALRNVFRRRGRLLLNLTLLGAAGAMFIAALDTQAAWDNQLNKAAALRDYDVEIKLAQPIAFAKIEATLAGVSGIAELRPADAIAAATGRDDGLMIVRTYPDGGHGSLWLRPDSGLPAELEFLSGGVEDGGAIVNQQGWTLAGRPAIGSTIKVAVEGKTTPFTLAGVIRQILTPATIYIPPAAYTGFTGRSGQVAAARLISVSSVPGDIAALANTTETALTAAGIDVEQVLTEAILAAAQGGHVKILIVALIAMAVIMAAVGTIGLASSQGSSVTERIREFGIMRTVGASGPALVRNILAEGLMIALLSLPIALVVGLPLGYGIGVLIGSMAFGLALPLTVSIQAIAIWIAILIVSSISASLVPARRAIRLTIRQTLAHT
ncbi:FtsX-like permease family protein [Devosia sp.]|uniref:FtsX-like permease family protein n=1 Tax=Devosia sp. TaxID=1871048 RepID=UPI0032641A04